MRSHQYCRPILDYYLFNIVILSHSASLLTHLVFWRWSMDESVGDASSSYDMSSMRGELQFLDDIPKAIIFTNLPESIFDKALDNPVKVRNAASRQGGWAENHKGSAPRFSYLSFDLCLLVLYVLHKSSPWRLPVCDSWYEEKCGKSMF